MFSQKIFLKIACFRHRAAPGMGGQKLKNWGEGHNIRPVALSRAAPSPLGGGAPGPRRNTTAQKFQQHRPLHNDEYPCSRYSLFGFPISLNNSYAKYLTTVSSRLQPFAGLRPVYASAVMWNCCKITRYQCPGACMQQPADAGPHRSFGRTFQPFRPVYRPRNPARIQRPACCPFGLRSAVRLQPHHSP